MTRTSVEHPFPAEDIEELRELIQDKRWPRVIVHDKVLALLFDREVRELLNRLNPRAALEEAEKARAAKQKVAAAAH